MKKLGREHQIAMRGSDGIEEVKLDVHLIVARDNTWYRMDRVVSMKFHVSQVPESSLDVRLGRDFEGYELIQPDEQENDGLGEQLNWLQRADALIREQDSTGKQSS